jgi:hypothetical protein
MNPTDPPDETVKLEVTRLDELDDGEFTAPDQDVIDEAAEEDPPLS